MKKTTAAALRIIPRLVNACFALFLGTVLVLMALVDKRVFYYASENEVLLPNAALLFFALPLVFLGVAAARLSKKRGHPSDRIFYALVCAFFAALFTLQLFVVKNIYFYGGWDFGTLLDNARAVALSGAGGVDRWYFGMYPNNLTPVYVLTNLFRLGALITKSNPYATVLAATCLGVNLSVLLSVFCVFKLTKNRISAAICALAGAFLIALSPWIAVPYTDSLSVFFPAAAMFFFCFLKDVRVKSFLVTLLLVFGAFLKPTVLLVLFAFAAVNGARLLRRAGFRRVLAALLPAALAVLCAFSLRWALIRENKTELEENLRMPFTHYLMMGLNHEKNGVFSDEDADFSSAFPDAATRSAANLAVIKKRLAERGLLLLFMKKTLCNFNDGTFAWGLEGHFYLNVLPAKTPLALSLRKVYYNSSPEHAALATAQQAVWLFVLLCALRAAFPLKAGNPAARAAMLALLGVSLFLMLFECRARYLYLFSPLFLMLAGCGLAEGADPRRETRP
ncbi:MAG: hypothetical protein LLF87_06430 [Eubacteriales bacterium]|nr:hypothetical protein [Eubacteriales bacterium]